MYPVTDEDREMIANRFTYHPPKENQIERYNAIRAQGLKMAESIITLTPPGRERSIALTKLDELVMFMNAAVARGEA